LCVRRQRILARGLRQKAHRSASATSATGQKTANPRQGIKTCIGKLRKGSAKQISQKTANPRQGIKTDEHRQRQIWPRHLRQKTANPRQGIKTSGIVWVSGGGLIRSEDSESSPGD